MSFRLEKSEKELQNFLKEERNKVAESEAALKEEKGKLKETTAELVSTQNAARSLEKEAESLLQRIRALEEAVGHLQGEADRVRAELREREADERRLCLNVEQLETDLRSSKAFAESLQTELHEKERREVEMLGEKEQAVSEVGPDPQHRQRSLCVDTFNRISQYLCPLCLRLQRRPGKRPSAGHKEPRRSWSRDEGSCGTWKKS